MAEMREVHATGWHGTEPAVPGYEEGELGMHANPLPLLERPSFANSKGLVATPGAEGQREAS